jgi:hypothetical protein
MTFTDDHVRTLPLDRGKAELLEELVGAEPGLEPADAARQGRRTWQVVVAAAAAVAAAVTGPVLLLRGGDEPATPEVATVYYSRALLTAPGWDLTQVYESSDLRFVDYWRGEENLSLSWVPAEWYAGRFADRDTGPGKRRVGETELVGVRATIWAYTEGDAPQTDHEAMTQPRRGWFLAVRGSGMDLAEFESLLAQVARTDEAAFAAGTASDDVTYVDDAALARMLTQVPGPPGLDRLTMPFQGFVSNSHVLTAVAHDVGCAWIEEYAAGRRDDAVAALADPASWPLFAGRDDADELTAVPQEMGQKLEQGVDPEAASKGSRC